MKPRRSKSTTRSDVKPSRTTRRPDREEDTLPTRKASKRAAFRSFVLYGRSGTGKTTLACSFPTPLLLLDVRDQGTDSIADVEGVDVRDITTLEELDHTFWWLTKHPDKYKTVVIDTMSQLQQLVVGEVAGKKKKGVARAGDWGTLTKRDWGDVAAVLKERIINFRDLKMNVVFIAQDRTFNMSEEEEDEQFLDPEVGPALSPSVAKCLNAAVSVIGNTLIRNKEIKKEVNGKKIRRKKTQYCLRIGPNPLYVTKMRKPKDIELPDLLIDPDYESIMEIIKGDV